MIRPSSILCPIDFSDASAGALRYAAVVAAHFQATLIVLTVENPLLTEALDLGTGVAWTPEDCISELQGFVANTFGPDLPPIDRIAYEVAVGKPPAEILRIAAQRSCGLVVMSSHGLTGARKLFFGSTTERVLRETTVPVVVTSAHDPGPLKTDDAKHLLRRLLVPIDLSVASADQAEVARGIAETLHLPVILAHVIEPVRTHRAARLHLPGIQADRRARADECLRALVRDWPATVHVEALVVYGDPAEEVAKVAHDREVGLIVVGLHGSLLSGPRMGSVTYRLLCLTRTVVLAIPPGRRTTAHADVPASASVSAQG